MDCEQLAQRFELTVKTWRQQGDLPLSTRQDYLRRLADLLQEHAEDISAAINSDFLHRSTKETYFLELFPTLKAIKYCLKNMKKWAKPRRKKVSYLFQPAKAYVQPQALGVVGVISPWNYPLYLSLVPAAYALAAGNRVMIKFSELTPKTGELIASLIEKTFPKEDVCLINGDVTLGKRFASLPFGHLIFTGSTTVGRQVMRAASENLTPVTLELGGKSPALISTSCPDHYLHRLLMGKCFNAGQTCIAPDYVLMPTSATNRFEQLVREFIDKRYPNMPNNDHYSSIISPSHFQRLIRLLEDAKIKGATVICLGDINNELRKMPLTLVLNPSDDMILMQEEIFGPILPVIGYETFDQAVSYVDKHRNPLALYYFGKNKAEIELVSKRQLSGALTINDTIMHIAVDDLPFGGVGESGMGCYHGQEGFDRFSMLKPIFIQRNLAPASWLYPPYGKLMRLFLKWIGRLKFKDKA
ncbi:coniferyl aldehyde dehydrogenase [Legionella sp. W05-934-2]|jgi:coniferyl-aldehyde dehydrogenase|uniref:coniferyl aldehyde dehydrogenase n=1 Tax=Legionella sp. W05-934-2 TaxID=1198649 RepID=UPI0034631446